ncbi:MAG: anti-sigma F factor [Clostridia bacterium]|nr:anti-sigma F factor [Clostridia bacterium]
MKKTDTKSTPINTLKLTLPSLSVNEGIARTVTAAFCAYLGPTATDIADIKCAVSEAVTNCIVHAYKNTVGMIYITAEAFSSSTVKITIRDKGCGIADVKQARVPLFTTDAESERSGLGFTVMESFMDKLYVRSKIGRGTVVTMIKRLGNAATE